MPTSQLRGFVVGAAFAVLVGGIATVAAYPTESGSPPTIADALERGEFDASTESAPQVAQVAQAAPSTTMPPTTSSLSTATVPPTTSTTTTTTLPPTTTTSTTTTTTLPPTTTTSTTTTTATTTTTTTATTTTTTTTTLPPTTTTTTTAAPGEDPPTSLPIGESELRALLAKYFDPVDVDVAYLVVDCESNFNAAAYNPSGPYVGLFQHLLGAWESRSANVGFAGADWWDAEANIAAAIPLWYGTPPYDADWHWPYCYDWAVGQLGE